MLAVLFSSKGGAVLDRLTRLAVSSQMKPLPPVRFKSLAIEIQKSLSGHFTSESKPVKRKMRTNYTLKPNRQNMGPTNAFDEQIEWTKQGKMWPYPIDNEYLIGPEDKTSFADHVFLEPHWRQHRVPSSKEVDHFMELVLVGLSKNPYMSVEKKKAHIDWFADYFKSGKMPSLLAGAKP